MKVGTNAGLGTKSNKIVIFFFQAEDGIRDHCVTGVQTCALPSSDFVAPTAINDVSINMHCPVATCIL